MAGLVSSTLDRYFTAIQRFFEFEQNGIPVFYPSVTPEKSFFVSIRQQLGRTFRMSVDSRCHLHLRMQVLFDTDSNTSPMRRKKCLKPIVFRLFCLYLTGIQRRETGRFVTIGRVTNHCPWVRSRCGQYPVLMSNFRERYPKTNAFLIQAHIMTPIQTSLEIGPFSLLLGCPSDFCRNAQTREHLIFTMPGRTIHHFRPDRPFHSQHIFSFSRFQAIGNQGIKSICFLCRHHPCPIMSTLQRSLSHIEITVFPRHHHYR